MSVTTRRFTTDANGKLPRGQELRANTTYEVARKSPSAAGRLPSKDYLLSWIRGAVLGDLRTLRAGMMIYQFDEVRRAKERLAGGNFLLAAGCCMALEYVARIFNGSDDATENLRQYADRFLAARYGEVADILWRAFRNGIVHGSWPQPICLETDAVDRVRVAVGVDKDDPHLDSIEGSAEAIFVVNAVQFLEDLEKSIDEFETWLQSAPDVVLERAAPRLLAISSSDARAKEQLRCIRQKGVSG